MLRHALETDLDQIEEGYRKHFAHEKKYGAFTVFREGIYPTWKDAEQALATNSLYLCETRGKISGSMILNKNQPAEYARVAWPSRAPAEKVMVIHLILVHPDMAGRGIGSSLVQHALETAKQHSCEAVRLDTGAQNIPACSLYAKLGFQVVESGVMSVGGMIPHDRHLFFEKKLDL